MRHDEYKLEMTHKQAFSFYLIILLREGLKISLK